MLIGRIQTQFPSPTLAAESYGNFAQICMDNCRNFANFLHHDFITACACKVRNREDRSVKDPMKASGSITPPPVGSVSARGSAFCGRRYRNTSKGRRDTKPTRNGPHRREPRRDATSNNSILNAANNTRFICEKSDTAIKISTRAINKIPSHVGIE